MGATFAERATHLDPGSVERQAIARNLSSYGGRLETVGTPALYSLMSVFVSDDYDVDRGVFTIAQLAAIGGACVLLASAVELPMWMGFLLATWAVWFFLPALADLREGNVSSFQWLCLAVVVAVARTQETPVRDVLVGGLLGVAAAVKPNLVPVVAIVLLPLAVDGRVRPLVRTAAGAAGGALACALGSAAWFGTPAVWAQWSTGLRQLAASKVGVEDENVGLVPALREATHRDLSVPVQLLVAAVCLVAVLRTRRRGIVRSRDEVLLAVGVGGAAVALVSPIFWIHYSVLLAPAAFACWRFAPARTRAATLAAVFLLSSVPRMIHDDKPMVVVCVLAAQVTLFPLALLAWTGQRARTEAHAEG
jgi:hypothetical protein